MKERRYVRPRGLGDMPDYCKGYIDGLNDVAELFEKLKVGLPSELEIFRPALSQIQGMIREKIENAEILAIMGGDA